MSMTISQGLRRISKLKGQLSELQNRASAAVTHLADQEPAFAFSASMEQIAKVRTELLALQTAVAIANATTTIVWDGNGMTLALARRTLDELRGEIAWLQKLPVKAHEKNVVATRDHDGEKYITVTQTFTCHLPEAKRADRVQALQDRFDKLNDIVETTNHKTTLGS